MINLRDGRYVIGFDNGYQLCKTTSHVFEIGVHMIGSNEPSLKENSLFYDGTYYKVGEGRTPITEDKISDDSARLLTMAAIARELSEVGVTKADVVLAVGLPFTEYGRNKDKMIEYYQKDRHLEYVFEGKTYDINLSWIYCFPQCYSAIAPRLANMKDDYIVIDVGSKTTDVIYVKDGIPVESRSITIESAMVKWMKQIQSELQVSFGKAVPEDEILKVILNRSSYMPMEECRHIRKRIKELLCELERELAERKYDLNYSKVIYVGGGSIVAKSVFEKYRNNVAYDCDIKANAKGYEFLAKQMIDRQG